MMIRSDQVLAYYRRGRTADLLQLQTQGEWGPLWSLPPCSVKAMERAARQAIRCRAARLRHWRRARLSDGQGMVQEVVVMRDLPGPNQQVWTLETGEPLRVDSQLEDDSVIALATGFHPTVPFRSPTPSR